MTGPEPDVPSSPRDLLARCLRSGRLRIGEILLGTDFTLRHVADVDREDLQLHADPAAARTIALLDEAGNFRPLRTAPTLRRGWLIRAGTLEGLERALEEFYPAALGLWFSLLRGTLRPTPLRGTLDRQTGMYRVTRLLTRDQAEELIAGRCCSKECLRTVLWEYAPGEPMTSLPPVKRSLEGAADEIPLLCREACNLVVAAARPVAKQNLPE